MAGRVRRVEPSAFTKVSALGVDEQRVWVIVDIITPPKVWVRLADGFRIEASIVINEIADAITVPVGALFRLHDAWHVYVIVDGLAKLRRVDIGHRAGRSAAISSGLKAGETVVLFPPSSLSNGRKVTSNNG